MATARFSEVVKRCGEPESHLLLIEPSKDRELQAAIKAKRVMTVFQDTVGSKADRGAVGFEPGPARQFLIFPKSLRDYEGKDIVGIKYELWSTKAPPKSQRAAPVKAPVKKKKAVPKTADLPSNVVVLPSMNERADDAPAKTVKAKEEKPKKKAKKAAKEKLAAGPKKGKVRRAAEREEAVVLRGEAPNAEVAEIKEKVRAVMEVLEQGKQIAAFNLLKKIVED